MKPKDYIEWRNKVATWKANYRWVRKYVPSAFKILVRKGKFSTKKGLGNVLEFRRKDINE